MMENFTWTQESLASWLEWLEVIGFIPVVCLLFGSFASLVSPRTPASNATRRALLGFALLSVILLAFVSLRLPGSLWTFDEFARIVPGWSAERNFYETFAIPYVLAVAIAGGLGLVAVADAGLLRTAKVTAYIGAAAFVFYDAQLLAGQYFRLPYYNGSTANRVLSSLPKNYEMVLDHIESHMHAPVLTLPLTVTDWSYLSGKDSRGVNVTYIGISPLFYLNGIDDYDGLGSFQISDSTKLMAAVSHDVSSDMTNRLTRTFSALGIEWIVAEHVSNPNATFAHVVIGSSISQALSESVSLIGGLDATPIASWGRYTLLQVGRSVSTPYISVDRSTSFLRDTNGLNRVANGTYNGSLRSSCPRVHNGSSSNEDVRVIHANLAAPISNGKCVAVLRSAYSGSWHAVVQQGSHTYQVPASLAYGFADGFTLPALQPGPVTIRFENGSGKAWPIGAAISFITFFTASAVCLWPVAERRKKLRILMMGTEIDAQ
jgi:hypothetical protein